MLNNLLYSIFFYMNFTATEVTRTISTSVELESSGVHLEILGSNKKSKCCSSSWRRLIVCMRCVAVVAVCGYVWLYALCSRERNETVVQNREVGGYGGGVWKGGFFFSEWGTLSIFLYWLWVVLQYAVCMFRYIPQLSSTASCGKLSFRIPQYALLFAYCSLLLLLNKSTFKRFF